jgi:hypothetical protein
VITTRTPIADIADHEGSSALRRDLEHLSSDAGAKLLRALGVKGQEAALRSASDEFRGHCLGLTLLGSYLADAYQTWLGEGPELSVLRILGLFDRPADEKAFGTLLEPPAILGLTECLTDLNPIEWRTILAK